MNSFMIRFELVQQIADQYGLKHTEVNAIIDDIFTFLKESVLGGERIVFRDFGTFYLKEKCARTVLHPKLKTELHLPAQRAIGFKVAPKAVMRIKTCTCDSCLKVNNER